MTFSTMKKILISSMFIAFFAAQGGLGAERGVKYQDNGNGAQTVTLSEVTENTNAKLSDVSEAKPEPKSHWWSSKKDMPLWQAPFLLIATLFDPFIDAVVEDGVGGSVVNVGKSLGTAFTGKNLQDNAVKVGLSVVSSVYGGGDAFFVPMAVDLAYGFMNSKLFFSLAKSIESKTTLDKVGQLALIGVGVYVLANAPVARAAAQTVSYLPAAVNNVVSTAAPGAPHCRAAATATPGQGIITWTSTGGDILASAVTASTSSTPFMVSLAGSPPGVNAQPCIACPLNDITNPCLLSWVGTGASVPAQFVFPNGTLSGPAFFVNAAVNSQIKGLHCARFNDDSLGVAYGSVNAGQNRISVRVYLNQAPLDTSPAIVSNTQTLLKSNPYIVDLGTTPSTARIGWEGINGANNVIYTGRITTSTGAIIEAENAISSDAQVQTEVSAIHLPMVKVGSCGEEEVLPLIFRTSRAMEVQSAHPNNCQGPQVKLGNPLESVHLTVMRL